MCLLVALRSYTRRAAPSQQAVSGARKVKLRAAAIWSMPRLREPCLYLESFEKGLNTEKLAVCFHSCRHPRTHRESPASRRGPQLVQTGVTDAIELFKNAFVCCKQLHTP